jgi:hypothetical protein
VAGIISAVISDIILLGNGETTYMHANLSERIKKKCENALITGRSMISNSVTRDK